MASANLKLVRSLYTAWERGDYSYTEWAHPEIEFEVVGARSRQLDWRGGDGRGMVRLP